MCEALFNLNRTFLSLPAGAVTAVAFSASMNDQYGKDPELGMAKRDSRESTPPPGPSRGGGADMGSPGAPRAVGKRTPRGNPQKKKDARSPDFDALEMAGQALVSMSPAPAPARALFRAQREGCAGTRPERADPRRRARPGAEP